MCFAETWKQGKQVHLSHMLPLHPFACGAVVLRREGGDCMGCASLMDGTGIL